MGFYEFDRIGFRAGPKKLQGSNHAELAKPRKVLRVRELNMRERVRQAAVAICFSSRLDSIQRLLYGAISQRVHMNDKALLVCRDGEFRKPCRIEQQFSAFPSVPVGLGHGSSL